MSNKVKSLTCAMLLLSGCGTVQLPDNVVVAGNALGSVKYSHTPAVEFDKVKRCIALNIQNENVRLSDSSGSFVGAYTKRYYSTTTGYTDFAPRTVVTMDEFHRYIVVNGSTRFSSGGLGKVLRYRLQVQSRLESNVVNFHFDNITMTQTYSGSIANSGFHPVYVQFGSPYEKALRAVEQVKNDLTNCLSQ